VCRCGVERSRLEALGYNFDLSPMATASSSATPRATSDSEFKLAGLLVGYRDTHVSRAWRIVFTLLFVILVGGVGYGLVTYTHLPLVPTRENVEIAATLEGHTKAAGNSGNAITSFLRLPGTVAVLEPTMTAKDLLKPLNAADLETGFCSAAWRGRSAISSLVSTRAGRTTSWNAWRSRSIRSFRIACACSRFWWV